MANWRLTRAQKELMKKFPRWAWENSHPEVSGWNIVHQFFVGGNSHIQVLEEYDKETGDFLGFSILGLLEN